MMISISLLSFVPVVCFSANPFFPSSPSKVWASPRTPCSSAGVCGGTPFSSGS
jgi:hypothetical protein